MSNDTKKPLSVPPSKQAAVVNTEINRASAELRVKRDVIFKRMVDKEVELLVSVRQVAYRWGLNFEQLVEESRTKFEQSLN